MVNAGNKCSSFALPVLYFSELYSCTEKGRLMTENGSVVWRVG